MFIKDQSPEQAHAWEAVLSAHSLAAWAGHQWGRLSPSELRKAFNGAQSTALTGDEFGAAVAGAIAALVFATTEPGIAGYGRYAPGADAEGIGLTVGAGLAFTATWSGRYELEYAARNNRRYLKIRRLATGGWEVVEARNAAPRDWARLVAAAAAVDAPVYSYESGPELLGAGFYQADIRRLLVPSEILASEEYKSYMSSAHNAGHMLCRPEAADDADYEEAETKTETED